MQPIRKKIKLAIILLIAAIAVSTVIYNRGGFAFGTKPPAPAPILIDADITFTGSNTNGSKVFQNNCATCHSMVIDGTGPAIIGVWSRAPKNFVQSLLLNPDKTLSSSEYGQSLFKVYKLRHPIFSDLSKRDLRDVVFFVNNFGVDRKF